MADIDLASFFRALIGSNEDEITQVGTGTLAQLMRNVLDSEVFGDQIEDDVRTQVEGLVDDLESNTNQTQEQIEAELASLVDATEGFLGGMIDNVGEALRGSISDALGDVSDIADTVITNIQSESSGAFDVLKDIGGSILEDIGITSGGAVNSVADTAQRILEIIGVDAGGAFDALERVIESIDSTTTGILNVVAGNASEVFDKIESGVTESVEAVTSASKEQSEAIAQQSEAQLEASEEQTAAIRDGISKSIEALTDASDGAISEVASAERMQAAAQQQQAEATVQQASMLGGIGDALGSIASPLSALFGGTVEGGEVSWSLENLRELLINSGVPEQQATDLVLVLSETYEGAPNVFITIVSQVLSWFYGMEILRQTATVVSNPVTQDIAKAVPSALPGIGEILELRNRDLLDDPLAVEMLRRQGFSEALAGGLLEARKQRPEVGIIQTWYLREFITEDHARRMFAALGFDEGDVDRLIDMSFYVPPPQDIILWAVREVFNVSQAQRFGQFDEFPEQFAELASKQGISEEFARNYWASHWRMPSLTRLFEMYHRKIIDRETLELTIKSHDYTPFWRDPLIDVAYKPLTRVDVRRMHDLGLLNEDQLQSRYEDLGFSPDDAAMMTQFTLEFNAEPAAESPEVIEAVARQPILNLFRDGVFLEDEALERLTELGMPESEARVFLEAERLEQERIDRKAQRDLVIEQAKAGALTFDEAFDRLSGLGFEPAELNRAVTEIHRARAAATKLPTREELDKMHAQELITDSEYVEALQRIGYAPFWAQRFLSMRSH